MDYGTALWSARRATILYVFIGGFLGREGWDRHRTGYA